ncbi:2,3-diaminopropionate biosynthesis protein SbnA [Micromonospora sp. NBC_01638]|uniref:2,3-diaminopropionate biosynthesis protein SbnA n=1 Tax=Micromonospora sp. NBC_01638 TaxID=2975982 RepID=UPI003863C8A8|nr:2,3-diaminopropionate biosynthesis protein SbnA [Micromonospora sp. NBC_01638]
MTRNTVQGILGCIGGTPLVELDGLLRDVPARVFAKLELANPGGSIKDRTALNMLLHGIHSGELVPHRSVVIESSSGNLAVGIAQICRYFGLRFICVVDAKTTQQNLAILRAFQAEIELIEEPDPATGEFLPIRLQRVRELMAREPHGYWPNQYANPRNPQAHHRTMQEIVDALPGDLDFIFCATSTCGTLTGVTEYVREHRMGTTVVAVDAVGSAIFGDESRRRLIPGHGASAPPPLLDPASTWPVVHVSDLDAVVGCRRLMAREAILAGGSSGAVVSALERYRDQIPAGATCVLVFPDRGERYLNTIYSDTWVRQNFGEVSHLWKESGIAAAGRL